MAKEIERKFLVIDIPKNINIIKSQNIHQTYLANNEEESLRVRKVNCNIFTMTFKSGRGLVREEIEFPISEQTYNQLINSNIIPLIKTRMKIDDGKYVYDLDIYHNIEEGNLKTIEVEFEDEKLANDFVPPDWFDKEVTGQSEYLNQNLFNKINM